MGVREWLVGSLEESGKRGWDIGSVLGDLQERWGFAGEEKRRRLGDRFRDVFLTQSDECGGGRRGEEGGSAGVDVRENLRTSPDARENLDGYLVYKGSYSRPDSYARPTES